MSRTVLIAAAIGVLALVVGARGSDPYLTPPGSLEIAHPLSETPYLDPAAYLESLALDQEWPLAAWADFERVPVVPSGGACVTDSDCNDGLACTDDVCVSKSCAYAIIDETDCNDNDVADTCELETRIGAAATGACQEAESIAPGVVYTGFTFGLASDAAGCADGGSSGIWYRYSPASDGEATILLRVVMPSPKIAIYSGCPATADDLLVCSRPTFGGMGLRLSVRSDVDYWIRIPGPVASPAFYSFYMTGPDEDGAVHDCNGNSVPDECDLDSGSSNDCNKNATPDECEPLAGLYGVGDSLQKLVTLNEGTGRVTSITPLVRTADGEVVHNIWDIEASLDGRRLYAVEGGGGGRRQIHTIDPRTSLMENSIRYDPGYLRSLEFDATGRLLGMYQERSSGPSYLVVVDPGTGRITIIGPTGLGDIRGLAFDSEFKTLYGLTQTEFPSKLVSIDPATGTATEIGATRTYASALEFDSQGRLLIGGKDGVLYKVDPATAQTTEIGSTRFSRLYGLAYVNAESDCDANGTLDLCDLYSGDASDCNDNGVLDRCEPITDCNGNNIADICDIASGVSEDCNFDSIADECQADCNANGVPDSCDLAYQFATSADCNGNLEPDECDIAGELSLDCDGDGVPDECELGFDCNANGIPDECDLANGTSTDTNRSQIPDECERTIFVDAHATGRNSGVRWRDAYTNLQSAIADAMAATKPVRLIWVAAGTYVPGDDREDTFNLVSGVRIYGGFAGFETSLDQRDLTLNRTVLSGHLGSDETATSDCCSARPSAGCGDKECEAAVCAESNFCCDDIGWGLGCAKLARETCGDLCLPAPSFHVVTASEVDSVAVLDGFLITGGDALTVGDGGGGLSVDSGSPTIANCKFVGNSGSSGGALRTAGVGHPRVINCAFLGNYGNLGGAVLSGGDSEPTFINSIFSGNHAAVFGGAIFDGGGAPTFTNCTITQNTAWFVGGGTYYTWGTFTNCIVWGNRQSNRIEGFSTGISSQIGCCAATVNYTDFTPLSLLDGLGNVDADPMFVDADGADDIPGTEDDDLRLRAGSPAIDAGSTGADTNAHRRGVQAMPTTDLAGNARVADDVDTPDTGIGGSVIVDMGAFEFFPDCNGNGVHDSTDVATGADCNANGIPDDCDIATGTSPDCNEDGVPDECDVASGSSADANDNGIPDECNCVSDSACDDLNVCTFDALCDDVNCENPTEKRGDFVGAGGVCGPDGSVDLQDVLAVLDAFAGEAATTCAPLAMDFAPCTSDGIIDLSDILAVLNGFRGVDPCCGN